MRVAFEKYIYLVAISIQVKIHKSQPNIYTLSWCFDLITRSSSEESWYSYSKSTLTDHANQANHTIHWKKATVIHREQDRPTRWIKEAVHIRKERHRAMNPDEGSYQLSHAYDRFLGETADRRIKTRKNWVPASSDEDLMMRSKVETSR